METILAKLLATLGTEEMFCVPSFFQSCYAFLKLKRNLSAMNFESQFELCNMLETNVEDWSVAVSTSGREQVVVVRLAVRPAIALEEIPGAQLLVAVSAGEVLGVPRATQRGDDLQHITVRQSLF